jgi:hypothetical protein
MIINNKLLKALDNAAIEYNVDWNAVHTPFGIVYDMSDSFTGKERYEFENGYTCLTVESVVKGLEEMAADF